ncbi:MAG: hypothetical protein ACLPLR_15715 [Terriglobales bacterium]
MKKDGRLFSVCSPKNKYFEGGLAGGVFWGFLASWGVYWLEAGGGLSPTRCFGIKTLAGIFWQSIEGKRLRGKVLIALELGSLQLLLLGPGMGGFACGWRGTPISSRAKSQA